MCDEKKIFTKMDSACIKGIAIILMFLHHLYAFPDRIANVSYVSLFMVGNNTIEYYVGTFGRLCVAMFMFLSGYGLYEKYNGKTMNDFEIYTRLKKIYAVYWRIFIIFIPIGAILKNQQIGLSLNNIILNFLAVRINYNGEWWFLTPYIFTIIVFPVILKIVQKKRSLFLDIFGIISLSIIYQLFIVRAVNIQDSVFSDFQYSLYWSILNLFLYLLPSFCMGMIFAKHNLIALYMQHEKVKIVLLIKSVILLVGVIAMRTQLGDGWDYIYAPIFILSSITLLKQTKIVFNMFCRLGKRSYPMWLIHSFYCYMYLQKIVFFPRYSILILVWLTVMSYVTSVLLDYLWEKITDLCSKRSLSVE